MRTPVVYISGPISIGQQNENVRIATEVFAQLRRIGCAVICPHWSWYAERLNPDVLQHLTHGDWLENDLPIVARCDAVLRLPGKSIGADQECEYARQNSVPVYRTVHALVQYFTCLKDLEPCTTAASDKSSPPEPSGTRRPVNHGWD